MKLAIAAVVLLASLAQAQIDVSNFMEADRDMPDEVAGADSCPDSSEFDSAGFYIDRQYGTKCFARQVYCSAASTFVPDDGSADSGVKTCPHNQFYVADGSDTCLSASQLTTSQAADCGVYISCDAESITSHVSDAAVFFQTDANVQFGSQDCQSSFANNEYTFTFDLTSDTASDSWDQCGATRTFHQDGNGGWGVKYTWEVRRAANRQTGDGGDTYDQTHGATITREKCFMATFSCYYDSDGTVTAEYTPSSPNILVESDTEELSFSLKPFDCGDDELLTDGTFATVYTDDEVCFRGCITEANHWHTDIRVQLRDCYATENADGSGQMYWLGDRVGASGANGVDDQFNWLCYDQSKNIANADKRFCEDFTFKAFRWADDRDNYAQTMFVWCDVNACELTDVTSEECVTTTACETEIDNLVDGNNIGGRRQRRAADKMSLGALTRSHVQTRMFVLDRPDHLVPFVDDGPRHSFFGDSLSMGMFAVGCALLVVVAGLLVALKRTQSQIKYGRMRKN